MRDYYRHIRCESGKKPRSNPPAFFDRLFSVATDIIEQRTRRLLEGGEAPPTTREGGTIKDVEFTVVRENKT